MNCYHFWKVFKILKRLVWSWARPFILQIEWHPVLGQQSMYYAEQSPWWKSKSTWPDFPCHLQMLAHIASPWNRYHSFFKTERWIRPFTKSFNVEILQDQEGNFPDALCNMEGAGCKWGVACLIPTLILLEIGAGWRSELESAVNAAWNLSSSRDATWANFSRGGGVDFLEKIKQNGAVVFLQQHWLSVLDISWQIVTSSALRKNA